MNYCAELITRKMHQAQPTIVCLKSTIKALEKGVKYVQS